MNNLGSGSDSFKFVVVEVTQQLNPYTWLKSTKSISKRGLKAEKISAL